MPNILIVDDTIENVKLLGTLLSDRFSIECAFSGEEALEILKDDAFDLILLDINMEGIDGFETCRRIKADKRIKDIPVIFLSSNIGTDFIVKAFKAGGVDYVFKPFNKEELLMRIDTHLSLKNLQDKLKMEKVKAEKSESKAIQATKAKSIFLANMSHEIRTPMNAILGYNQLLKRTKLDKKQFDYLNKLNLASNTLLGIINDILDFSKIEADKLVIEKEVFNLEEIVSNMCSILNVKAQDKGIYLVIDIDTRIPFKLIGDPLRLNQIFLNLVNNAIKFSSQGEILFKAQFLKLTDDKRIKLQFAIEDTGIGMTQEQLEGLFKPFTQADSSITRKFGGTGLGLSICHKLVNHMGGKIWAESEYGKGSKFFFTAYFGITDDYTQKNYSIPEELHNLKVLIINGLPVVRKVTERLLTSFMFNVHTVDNATKAILSMKKADASGKPYQLVLFDYNLPEMNGIEATSLIMNEPQISSKPKVIMFADSFQMELKSKCEAIGVSILLEKPLCPSDLYNSILSIFCNKDIKMERFSSVTVSSMEHSNFVKNSSILVVEDNPVNQEIVKEFLSEEGIKVIVAGNGEEALDVLKDTKVDLILMDLQMPVMDGYMATSIIKQDKGLKGIPIIALTAHALADERKKCLHVGMDDYISKPFVYKKFIETICNHLDIKKSADVNKARVINKAAIPEIQGLCIDKALKSLDNNLGLLKRQISTFISNNTETVHNLEKAYKTQKLGIINLISHSIKSSAGWIGAIDLSKKAEEVEIAAKNKDLDKLNTVFAPFVSTFKDVMKVLEDYADSNESAKNQNAEIVSIQLEEKESLVKIIDNIIQNFDIDITQSLALCRELITKLENSEYSEDFHKFNEYVEDFDFENAIETGRELKNKVQQR